MALLVMMMTSPSSLQKVNLVNPLKKKRWVWYTMHTCTWSRCNYLFAIEFCTTLKIKSFLYSRKNVVIQNTPQVCWLIFLPEGNHHQHYQHVQCILSLMCLKLSLYHLWKVNMTCIIIINQCLKLSLMEGQRDMHIINQCLKLSLYHLWKVNLTCIIINQCFKSLYHSWKVNMYIISETVQYIINYKL